MPQKTLNLNLSFWTLKRLTTSHHFVKSRHYYKHYKNYQWHMIKAWYTYTHTFHALWKFCISWEDRDLTFLKS